MSELTDELGIALGDQSTLSVRKRANVRYQSSLWWLPWMTRCRWEGERMSSGDEDSAALPPLGVAALPESDPEMAAMLSRAAVSVGFEWNPPPCPEPSRLDDWFFGAARAVPFFLEVHEEVTKSWTAPFSARSRPGPSSILTTLDGRAVKGYMELPPVERSVAMQLCPKTANSWRGNLRLPSWVCKLTRLVEKPPPPCMPWPKRSRKCMRVVPTRGLCRNGPRLMGDESHCTLPGVPGTSPMAEPGRYAPASSVTPLKTPPSSFQRHKSRRRRSNISCPDNQLLPPPSRRLQPLLLLVTKGDPRRPPSPLLSLSSSLHLGGRWLVAGEAPSHLPPRPQPNRAAGVGASDPETGDPEMGGSASFREMVSAPLPPPEEGRVENPLFPFVFVPPLVFRSPAVPTFSKKEQFPLSLGHKRARSAVCDVLQTACHSLPPLSLPAGSSVWLEDATEPSHTSSAPPWNQVSVAWHTQTPLQAASVPPGSLCSTSLPHPVYVSGTVGTLLFFFSLDQVSRHAVVFTDASAKGWEATYNGHAVSGLWTGPQLKWHINCLELLAVRLALGRLKRLLHGKHVLVRTDNTATVAYINNQGGLRSHR
ncbi:hypothetical protein M9458_032525, partial [Cirrhinus mrigala]